MHLLLAEDDTKLLKSLKYIFECNEYCVDAVTSGTEAFQLAAKNTYDALILDIMMPGMDGIEVLRELKELGIKVPTLFLTAKTEVYQRVEGLDAGADDYICKPFSTEELLARVRALLRRSTVYTRELTIFGDLTLNGSTYELSCGEHSVPLSDREFQITKLLLQRQGVVIMPYDLIERVWGWDSDIDVSVLWVHISNIRKKMGSLNSQMEIKYVRNRGYRLDVAPIK